MHTEVLDFLLANTCHNKAIKTSLFDGEVSEFTFDLHCVEVVVTARLITVEPKLRYEVLGFTSKEI